MRRKLPRSSVALAVAAVVVGAGTTVALRGRLAALEARAEAAGDLRPAVVATADLSRGARIVPGHVETVEMPAALLPPTALTSEDQAIGATLTGDVAEGEVLTGVRVARAGPIAALVPEGFRAMSVTVAIAPGLLAVAPGRPFAETLASGVEVLAVRETSLAEASVATVVLLVTSGQASELAAGRTGAELTLTVLPAGATTMSG